MATETTTQPLLSDPLRARRLDAAPCEQTYAAAALVRWLWISSSASAVASSPPPASATRHVSRDAVDRLARGAAGDVNLEARGAAFRPFPVLMRRSDPACDVPARTARSALLVGGRYPP